MGAPARAARPSTSASPSSRAIAASRDSASARTCAASSARSDAVRASAALIARVEAFLEVGDELVAHAVSPVGGVGVRGVLAPLEAPLAQVRQDLLPRHREQRADDVARSRPHAREPGRPGAPQEPQQQRLRLVVARVGDRDRGRLLLVAHAAQVGVALAARGLLEAAPLARGPGAHVGRSRPEGDVEPLAQGGAEGHVLRRARPQAVVQVGGHHAEPPPATQRGERVRERDGVLPPGEADHERAAPGRHPRGPQGPIDGRDEGRQPQAPGLLMRGGRGWRCRDSNPGLRGYEPRALTS